MARGTGFGAGCGEMKNNRAHPHFVFRKDAGVKQRQPTVSGMAGVAGVILCVGVTGRHALYSHTIVTLRATATHLVMIDAEHRCPHAGDMTGVATVAGRQVSAGFAFDFVVVMTSHASA